VQTWLEETWGLRVPVIGAPMAGPAGGRLAAAVSSAGALGMVGVGGSRTDEWLAQQAAIAAAADRP
jgi:nitronate monooxygenase